MILVPVAIILLVLIPVIAVGGARIMAAANTRGNVATPGRTLPRATVIVPVSGTSPRLSDSLVTILQQDYPGYEVVFTSLTGDEQATDAIRAATAGTAGPNHPAIRHVTSGRADRCGQKNLNLLTGISAVEATVPVLVFCDAGHILPSHWLRKLVEPIAFDGARVTTSYHHVLPASGGIAPQGRALSVLFLHFLQLVPFLSQPWGGSTAILRSTFDELGVRDTWGRTVVDDVSLACLLDKARIRVTPVPAADSTTPLAGETAATWSAWLTRQLMYLKLFYPATWLLGGLAGLFVVSSLTMLIGCVVLSLAGATDRTTGAVSVIGLLLFAGVVLTTSALHPAPRSRIGWTVAGFIAPFMALWCHCRTWFAEVVVWRDITYRVSHHGTVVDVR